MLTLLCLAAAPAMGLAAPAAGRAESAGALLLRMQEESAVPLIQYCVASNARLKKPLEAEHTRFRKKFRKATAPLRSQIASSSELSSPMPRALLSQFESMDGDLLKQARQMDAGKYCATLQQNLSQTTAESIRRNMASAFAQYVVVARQGR